MLNTTPIRYITAQSFYIQPEYIIFLSLSYNHYTGNLAWDKNACNTLINQQQPLQFVLRDFIGEEEETEAEEPLNEIH